MTETAIHAWLNEEREPADLYELLGRLRFDPDRDQLLALVKAAYAVLLPYQTHPDPRVAQRAAELQRELSRAEGILCDPGKLQAHHDKIIERLRTAYTHARSEAAAAWSHPCFLHWLRQQAVHPDSFARVASLLSFRADKTFVVDRRETENDRMPADDATGFVLEEQPPGIGPGEARARVFDRARSESVEVRQPDEPPPAVAAPGPDDPISAILLPSPTATARRRRRKARQTAWSKLTARLAQNRIQQFLFFVLLAGVLLLSLLFCLALLLGR